MVRSKVVTLVIFFFALLSGEVNALGVRTVSEKEEEKSTVFSVLVLLAHPCLYFSHNIYACC